MHIFKRGWKTVIFSSYISLIEKSYEIKMFPWKHNDMGKLKLKTIVGQKVLPEEMFRVPLIACRASTTYM